MPVPFEVRWSEAEVADVLARVRAYPWPPQPDVADGWAYGCDGAWLKGLCAYWADGYDWRAAVADLNRFPQFTARVEDFDLHFLHVVGEAGGKRPLILTHGWPGSHYEFWASIEKLAYPSRHGGDPADAFDLVVPSLPGFGFSSKPARPRCWAIPPISPRAATGGPWSPPGWAVTMGPARAPSTST
jgi:microsomal epoxide hydrolase